MYSIPNASGIYRITCIVTGKFYIGSSINLFARWNEHRNMLRRNVHHSITLQRAWNKHSEDAFSFEVLELVLPMSLTAREQYWFNKLKPFGKKGFNIAITAGSNFGMKASAETREKLRISHLGKTLSEEQRQGIRELHTGRKRPTETRERLRLAKLGHEVSPETRAKISMSKTGHKLTPEAYTGRMKSLIVIAPDGTEQTIHGIKQFCREHHLNASHLLQVAKGKERQHKGWKARFPE